MSNQNQRLTAEQIAARLLAVGWSRGVQDCIRKVEARLRYLECYRCNCDRVQGAHAVGCRAEYLEANPTTVASYAEMLAILQALKERGLEYCDAEYVRTEVERLAEQLI